MAYASLVMGESGTGKSTSLRNLDPSETYIIALTGKPLPFRGGASRYSVDKKNYRQSDDWEVILKTMRAINERAPHIKTLIIDDFQYLMSNEYMARAKEKGYGIFTDIAQHAFFIIDEIEKFRDDLNVFVLSHTDIDDFGRIKFKTVGKMVDNFVNVEGKFSVVFFSEVVNGQYKFLVKRDNDKPGKSPMGMFDEKYVDNDLASILPVLKSYFLGDEVEDVVVHKFAVDGTPEGVTPI